MEINQEMIEHLAHLSRLNFNEAESAEMKADLNKMLGFVEKMNELNTDGVEPLIYMNDEVNVLREDVTHSEVSHEEALSNAPKRDSDFFRVPKVIS
jgi:aspartyl-tRNA(Asn)/glutamyl-tRNA(Gln) amidotransferase subunit C